MGDLLELTSWPNHEKAFYKFTSSGFRLEIKAFGDAFVGLAAVPKSSFQGFVIAIDNQQQTWIKSYPILDIENNMSLVSSNLLSPNEFRQFWITWHAGSICFGSNSQAQPLITYKYTKPELMYVTLYTSVNSGHPVYWRIIVPPIMREPVLKPITGGELHWVQCDDVTQFPNDAFIGGFEEETLYIIRAFHAEALTPGKFVPSKGKGYVPWTRFAHEKISFEVLCGFDCTWVASSRSNIPPGAVVGGYSQNQQRELLYIGRAKHKGHIIPGKVQAAYGVCFIPFEGQEIGIENYEILIAPETSKHPLLTSEIAASIESVRDLHRRIIVCRQLERQRPFICRGTMQRRGIHPFVPR